MQARCPHCQAIFTAGHPGVQPCPNCGRQVDVPEVVQVSSGHGLPPGGPGAPEGGGPPPGGVGGPGREDTPWERRGERGWWTGLWETWRRTITEPQPFFQTIKPKGSWSDAVLYAWILYAIAGFIQAAFGRIGARGAALQMEELRRRLQELPPAWQPWISNLLQRSQSPGSAVAPIVASLVLAPLLLIAFAAIVHLSCLVFSADKNGYYATLRALCFASAPVVFQALTSLGTVSPLFSCVGFLVTVWHVALLIMALASLQEMPPGKAAAVVLVPVVVLVCCCCGGLAVIGGLIASGVHRHAGEISL